MPTFVLDTSVVIKWYHHAKENHVAQARKLWEDFNKGKITIILPDILPLELFNVFIKAKASSAERSYSVIARLYQTSINFVEVSLPVLKITGNLMEQYQLTSYDAYFLALAKYEECTLISDDKKAHGKITDGTILMLEDY